MNNSSASFTGYLWIPHGLTYQSRLRCNNHPLTWYSVLIHTVLSPASFRVFPSALTTFYPQLKRDLSLLPHCEMVSNRMYSVLNTRKIGKGNQQLTPDTKKLQFSFPPRTLQSRSFLQAYAERRETLTVWELLSPFFEILLNLPHCIVTADSLLRLPFQVEYRRIRLVSY